MKYRLLVLTLLLFVAGLLLTPTAVTADLSTQTIGENITLRGFDFADGSGAGHALLPRGLSSADGAFQTEYTSAVIPAPLPFNVVFSRWQVDLPPTAVYQLTLRTSLDGQQWGDWVPINPNEDWMDGDHDEIVGDMLVVPPDDQRHHYLQYQLQFESGVTLSPTVWEEITFTFIDSTDGPTSEQLLAEQQRRDSMQGTTATDGYPKPTVVSRAVWCTHPDCNYSGVAYYPTSHLIVHHTVSGNYGSNYNYAEVMRAIWYYHTYTNGWGDIGYNYLADPNGVLYEGHLGGDNVVGTHATAANRGSMAVSLIGNYVDLRPSDPMLNSVINLLAWKANQQNINVFDASDSLPDVGWGLPHLMGHRDVYGGVNTQCPGDEAYKLLPWLRQQIANRIGFADPYLYAQETGSEFSMSNPNLYWWEPGGMCGHNLHAYYTWSTTSASASSNWGEWRPTIPADGRYRIDVYTPFCSTGRIETFGARYEINHANGRSYRTLNQDDNVGSWATLGEFDLLAGQGNIIRLTDLTVTDSGQGVWFDTVRLLPLGPMVATAANQNPVHNSWLTQRTVTFDWVLTSPATVQEIIWQVASDPTFNHIVAQQAWTTAVTAHSHTFSQDYAQLYWRIVVNSLGGNQTISATTFFGLDATPPTATLTAIYRLTNGSYILHWRGDDNLSGIASYRVDVSNNNSSWQPLWAATAATSGTFQPINPDSTYYFRVYATDGVGNQANPPLQGQMNSGQAILLSHVIMLPFASR